MSLTPSPPHCTLTDFSQSPSSTISALIKPLHMLAEGKVALDRKSLSKSDSRLGIRRTKEAQSSPGSQVTVNQQWEQLQQPPEVWKQLLWKQYLKSPTLPLPQGDTRLTLTPNDDPTKKKSTRSHRSCFIRQTAGLTPGVCATEMNPSDYW